MQIRTVEHDVVCELASAIVERQFHKDKGFRAIHSYVDETGALVYKPEVEKEFNSMVDLIDEILNPEV